MQAYNLNNKMNIASLNHCLCPSNPASPHLLLTLAQPVDATAGFYSFSTSHPSQNASLLAEMILHGACHLLVCLFMICWLLSVP